jgi:beta-1,4-mannosyltransferase
MAELPWGGPMACHFHWLASIVDRDSIRRFEATLRRLKDQKRSIVWTVHNVLPHDNADIATAVRVRRAIVEAADLIHIMNERTPELVEPYFSLAGKRVFYSPHPSYLADHPRTASRAEARFQLGLSPETTVFLCFGAIRTYKGIEDLITAAHTLERNRPDLDWVLVVAGVAKDQDLVERIRRNRTLDRRLVVYPHKVRIDDVQYFYRAADYAVCAYRSSLNSGSAMLALSFGVPLVVPETAAFSEFLSRGVGIGYSPDEPGALTAALTTAIETDPVVMRDHAFRLAEERSPRQASNTFFDGLTYGLESQF